MEIYGPEQFGTHLICGMGDTEQDIQKVAQKIRDMAAIITFCVLPGAQLVDGRGETASRDQQRRALLACFLIGYAGRDVSQMRIEASAV